jgi:membrane protease YdiL (CAAX protease family)
MYAGIAGPAVAAIALLYLEGRPAQREDFWDRVFELKRLRPRWLAAIFLLYPVLTAIGIGIDWVLSGRTPGIDLLARLLANPLVLLAYAGFILLLGPVPEELGWRGYALDRLQLRGSPLNASLLLGVAWVAWHLPQFFIAGTYQHGLGIGTVEFWLFVVTAIALSVLMTWIYDHTDRSVLSAIVVHAIVNFTRATVTVSVAAEIARTLLLVLLAAVVAVSWRRRPATS